MKLGVLFLLATSTTGLRIHTPHRAPNGRLQLQSDRVWLQMEVYKNTLKRKVKDLRPGANSSAKEQKSQLEEEIEILKQLEPCATCKTPKRYGEVHDGGYVMCSEFVEDGQATAGYSFGVQGYDGWGRDISTTLHLPIYQFDCTDPRRPTCEGCDFHFYDLCISAKGDRLHDSKYKTLKELMALNGHGNRGDTNDLIMQLDVESYEWDLFADPSTAESMKEFSQISIEFHGILQKAGCCNDAPLSTKLKALQNLNKLFVVTHLHGNNYEAMQTTTQFDSGERFMVPTVLEVLYTRRNVANMQACSTDPGYLSQDAPNNARENELPHPHLPK